MKKKKLSIKQLSTMMVMGLMVLAPIVAQAGVTTPPTGDLTAKWWQWAVSIPAASNPIVSDTTTDPTGELCDVKQSDVVWFLAGTTGGSATRKCTIPFGKAILFPILTAEWSVAEAEGLGGNCFIPNVMSGTSEEALRECAKVTIDHVTLKQADIDGVNVQNLDNYRVQSPLFGFKAVQNNVFAIPKGKSQSVSDGYWILLPSLPKGQHTVHFHGTAEFSEPELGFTFDTEVTYHISIVDEDDEDQ